MPEHNQKSIGREVIEERIGLMGCWKGDSENAPWFITVSVGSNCAGHSPATLWNCYWGGETQRTAGRKCFCASQRLGSWGTEKFSVCPITQSQSLFQATATSHSCKSMLGILLVLLNSDTISQSSLSPHVAPSRILKIWPNNCSLRFCQHQQHTQDLELGCVTQHRPKDTAVLLKSSHLWYQSSAQVQIYLQIYFANPADPRKADRGAKWAQRPIPTHFFPYQENPTIPFSCDSSILPARLSPKPQAAEPC